MSSTRMTSGTWPAGWAVWWASSSAGASWASCSWCTACWRTCSCSAATGSNADHLFIYSSIYLLTLKVRGSQLHIWVRGGGWFSPPPGKCSINGPNELKFCVWPHMGCVWEIPWPKRYNHVSGSRLSPRSKNPKISGILKFGYIFQFFRTELTSKNPKTLPIEFLVKKWSILM